MTQKKEPAPQAVETSVGAVVYDEKKKLSELQSMILQKGDSERERILEEAHREAAEWLAGQTAQLDAMVASIRADATKRSHEVTARHMIEAESNRDKDRLRLQNELIQDALAQFQNALVAFSGRPDYEEILTGVAAEVCSRFPKGQKIKLRLRAEDATHGPTLAGALKARFPELDIAFDGEGAPILGGVLLYSEEEKWRVVADWKSKVEEMADAVARAVLAEL